jgi:hypothetical protein
MFVAADDALGFIRVKLTGNYFLAHDRYLRLRG